MLWLIPKQISPVCFLGAELRCVTKITSFVICGVNIKQRVYNTYYLYRLLIMRHDHPVLPVPVHETLCTSAIENYIFTYKGCSASQTSIAK